MERQSVCEKQFYLESILEKFGDDANEKYLKSPIFSTIVDSIYCGGDLYKLINNLVNIIEEQQNIINNRWIEQQHTKQF